MKLEEMKRIADARTKDKSWLIGCLEYDRKHYAFTPDVETQLQAMNDSEFIAMASNQWDKLMAVVEAAKNLKSEAYRISCFPPGQDSYEIGRHLLDELDLALEKLEKE